MAKRARAQWSGGDIFAVRLTDGVYSLGQVISPERDALNSVLCVLFRETVASPTLSQHSVSEPTAIACLLVTRDLLDNGTWPIVGRAPVQVPASMLPSDALRVSGWIGAEIYGSGIVANFLKAFHGIAAWNMYHDPEYFDKMLASSDMKPKNVTMIEKK